MPMRMPTVSRVRTVQAPTMTQPKYRPLVCGGEGGGGGLLRLGAWVVAVMAGAGALLPGGAVALARCGG